MKDISRSILFFVVVLLAGCFVGCRPSNNTLSLQPTPTITGPLSERDAIRHIRSHVITLVQILDPFQVSVATIEKLGDVYTVSYLSPNPFGEVTFEEELKNVAHQATEGFVRAESRLPYLVISVTSVDTQGGSRMVMIDYESAYRWFTGQIDNSTYESKWQVFQ